MRNLYSGTRHVSRLFSWMSLLLGTLLLCFNVSYARADVRTYGGKNPAARHYAVCHNYAQHLTVAGNLPVTANVTAVPVRANTPDGKPAVAAYDITISDGGREWQPAPGDPVLVTLADKKFVDGKLLDIYHQGPNGPEFVATVMPKNGSITFPGYSFSVYIVGESHGKDRVKVVFKNGSTEIASYYVKPDDRTPDTMFKKIVYDPGVGEVLGQYMVFRGWTKNQNYTTATADNAMTIVGVREDLRTLLGGAFNDDTVVTYYALIYKSFPVTYEDENNVVLHTDNNLLLRTETSLNYTVNMDYTPADDEHALVGWNVAEGGDHINGYTSGTLYPNNTNITINGPVQFSVYAPSGYWLVFHENKGTYVPPQFVLAGNYPTTPTVSMERLGYTFGGWYTDEACTSGNEFNFNQYITARTHVYAKWIAATQADYTVIIWKQNVKGTGYDFVKSHTIANASVGYTPNAVSHTTNSATVSGTTYSWTGFTFSSTDQASKTIAPEGNTVVNVYFNRNTITLNFKICDYTYTATTNNNGTQYGLVNGNYVQLTRSGSTYTAVYTGTRYTRSGSAGNYTYTPTTNTNNTYGLVNGAYEPLSYDDGGWFGSESWSFTYTGTRYTRSNSRSWRDYITMTGLYGSTLADNNYTWPTAYDWYANGGNNCSTSGTRTTFMDAFLIPGGGNSESFYGVAAGSGSSVVEFYKQKADLTGYEDTWSNRSTTSSSNSSFSISDKYNGFYAHHYTINGTTTELGGKNAQGYYATGIDYGGTTLRIYFNRLTYTLAFLNGTAYTGRDVLIETYNPTDIRVIDNIAYGADISSYASYKPDASSTPEGFVFEGWFVDDRCTQPFDFTNATLPEGGLTLYAKWRQREYRVFLHPNAGTDPALDWGSDDQEMNFRVAYGAKVSTPYGRREGTGYEFVGWYTDPACHNVFNGEAFVLNETTVTASYDKTVDMTDVMDKWGNGATMNKDVDRFWITKKLDLYAKWRKVIAGADGIQVYYDAGTGSGAPTDVNMYKDNTPAIAGAAATPAHPSDTVFSYWDIMEWNGTEYVPSGDVVYPGGDYNVLIDYAQMHREPNTSDPSVYDTSYVLQLRAHYEAKESKTPTFIVWYNNYAGAAKDTLRQDGNKLGETAHADLHINEAVDIPAAPTRDGYTFLGWYRKKWTNASDVTAVLTPTECEPDFLYYNNTTNKYYKEAAYTNEATQVAADERNPYDYLYAIWEPDTITFDLPDEFCYGAESGSYTLPTTSIEGITGTWNPATINTTSPDTYYPVFTPANGQCINKQVKDTITVKPRTEATISGETAFCEGGSTTLSVPYVTGNTYAWSTGATTASITVSAAGNYSVTVTQDGCQSEGDTTVVVYTKPVVNSITVPTGDICPGTGPFNVEGIVTAGTGGAITTYTWDGDATAANAASTTVAEPTAATERCNKTYSVTLKVADDKGCESDPKDASFTVKDDAAPTIDSTSLDRTLTSTNCTFIVPDLTGEVRAISSDNCTTKPNLTVEQDKTPGSTLAQGSTTTVTVTVKDSCGNSAKKEIKVTVPAAPTVTIIGDDHVCYNGSLTLKAENMTGTAPLHYVWNSDATTADANLVLNDQVDTNNIQTATLVLTDANGCTANESHTYNVYKPLRGGRILYEKHTCNTGDTVVVVKGTTPASGGVNGRYEWYSSTDASTWNKVLDEHGNVINTESYTLPPTHHLYVRRAYVTDCGTVYTPHVYIENSGNVNVGTMTGDGSTAYCYGSSVSHTMTASSVTLASGSPFSYEWYTSTDGEHWTKIDTASHQSFTYTNPNFTESTSIYFKYAIAISGCDVMFANQQVQLDVNPLPTVTLSDNTTQTINLGESIDNVQVTYANGDLDITGMPAGVTNSTLTATPVTISGTPTAAGTFTVKATATSNTTPTCGTAIDSFKIIVNDTLVLEPFVMTATEICASASEINDTVTITESAGNTTEYTYAWDVDGGTILEGQGTQTIKVQWATAGDNKHVKLTVTRIATGGLSHKDDYIDVNPVPTISINDIAEVCPNTEFNVKGNVTGETTPSYAYTWSTTSTGLTVTPAAATVTATAYTSHATATGCGDTTELKLTVKDGNSCQVSATKNITVKTPAAPNISTSLADNDWGCTAPTSVPQVSDFTVTDECNSSAEVTLTPGTESVDGCTHTKMWTASYTNACGATATKSVTFTWKEMTKPVITTTLNLDSTLTCNWSGTEPQQSDFTVTDDCNTSATATVTAGTLDESVSCQRSRTWTATYQNTCGMKADTVMVKYTWPYDETKPAITAFDTVATPALNCKYVMPDLSAATLRRSTDGCSTPTFVSQSITAGTSYDQTASEQTLPVKVYVEDLCGNKDSVSVTVTVPASIALTIDTSASNCYGQADGFLNYTITGGVANYTLDLTGTTAGADTKTAAGSYSFNNLADGTYSLKVTDANGCEATATTTIQQINTTLQITANSNSWTYDGGAHSDNGFKVTFGSESLTGTSGSTVTLANGDVIGNVTISGSITNVTESPVANTIAPGITITRSGNDVTCYYNIDTTFGKLTITNSGDLALNCVDQSKTYDGTALSYTAVPTVTTGTTVSYSTDGGATWSTTVPSITNVSESPLTVNVKAENSNYTTATCSYTLTINPAPLTIKLDSTKIYDGTAFVSDYASTPAGYTITGLVSGDAVTAGAVTSSDMHKGDYVYNATASITTPFATTKGIGNYNVTYDLTQHIDCRDVTLTSGTTSRKYDGTALSNNTVTVSGSGWLSGKEATYSDFATITDKGSKKNAFTYTLASGEVATDYCVTIDTGMLTVTCREITITAASANYDYDGNVHTNTAFTVTGDGMVSGESVTPVIEGSIQFPSQSPQTNAITGYTFNPATTADNYCVTTVDGTLTMKCVEKNITIVADNGTWTYDGTSHTQNSYTVTYMDGGSTITATVPVSANGVYKFANGDSLHVVITGEAKNVTTGVNNVVAGYTIYHGTENMAACYNVTTTNGTLVVNCRAITLTSGTASKTYDGSALKKETVTIGGAGMVSGESLSYTNFAQITNVGSTNNTFEYSFVSPALASNYCVTDTTFGTLTVNCKEVTIAANSATRVYNGAPLTESGFTASALESGDSHTFAVTMADTCTITNVGTKANVIATVDGIAVVPGVQTAVGNYCVTTSNGTLTVDCKKVTIRAKNASKEYDATPLTQPEFTNTALESGDTHTFTVKMTAASTITDAGTQANVIDTVDGVAVTTGVETAVGNYCVTTEEGTLTVTVVDLPEAVVDMTCPTSGDTTRMYDGTPLAPIVTATSSLSSLDTFHIEYSTDGGTIWSTTPASVTHVSEGTKTVKVRATNPNYKPVYCDFTMQVTCRKDTLLSNAATKVYDGTPLENTTVTVKGDGFVSGETPTYSSFANITDVGKATNTFNYALPTTVDASDYCITVLYDTLEITPAPLTIKLDTQKVYDATVFVSDYTATTDGYTITGLVSGDAITAGVVTSSASDVNTYIDSVTTAEAQVTTPFTTTKGISNYDVTYDLKQVIICKAVTLTAMDSTKVYDGVASTQPGFTATALEATDPHTFAVQMADTCTITNVGTKANVIAKVDGVDITPGTTTTVGNYCVDVVNGVLEITPAPLTIKLDTQKVYDAMAFVSDYMATTVGYTITGLVGSDYITAGVVTSSAADVNTYIDSIAPEATISTPFATNNGIDNYDVTYDLKQVIICKAVTLTAMDSTKVYDGVASTQPGFTATALEATDPHTFAVQMADTCTITNVGTKANVIAKVDGVDITPGTTTTVGNYCVDVVNGMLEITPAPLTIKLVSTKVYDSTALVNNYGDAEFTYTGLVSGDAITAGQVKTSGINVGTYIDSVTTAEAMVTTDFATTNGISNYDVTYDLKQDITCKEVTIKSNGAGKTYDALPLTEPGFTATALEATDPHTFTVTMTSSSTITNVGKQPNIIETVDGVAVTLGSGNVVGNYCVTIEADTLEVVCMPVTITAQSKTKEFDGTPLTWDGFDATALATTDPHVFTVKMTAASTITNAGSTPNVIDSVDGVHVEPGVSTAVGNYCVTAQNGTLKITPRPLLILDTLSNKMYDGDTLRVEYSEPEVEAIGLVTGDFLTAGQLSTDNYIAGYYRYEYTAPLSTAVMSEGNALISSPFATDKGISNYTVSYKVKLTITPRPLEITAASDSKVYDCVDLEKDAYSITGGALATTDHIDTVFVTGLQHCVGSSANVPSGAIILHGVDTVTGSYNITYVNGLLEILPITTGFVCPADLDITLWHSTCDTNVTLPAEATLSPSLPAGCVSITNNLVNPLPAGVHTITWSLKDECGNLMTTCDQTITVNYAKCDTAVDYDGNKYPSERIGCNCWTVPNLKSEHYSDGTDIANYTRYDDKDSLENIYGKLYSWYSAARVAEDDNTAVPADSTSHSGPYVEGVCPAGWALPTVAEYLEMFAASGSDAGLVKSPSTEVWLPGKQGTAPNKFNAYGAGYYDGSIHRYLNLLAETHFWAADNANGSATAKNFVLNYYCSDGLVEDALKGLGYSIRCIQKK